MYVVRNKKTKEILHVNPAPVRQALKPLQVYCKYNRKTMEIGKIEGPLPEHFHIDKNDKIVEWSLEEKVKGGIVNLDPKQEIEENQIVDKSLVKQVKEGLIQLSLGQKIEDGRIVAKTLEEQVKDGVLELAPHEKIVDNQIVPKTLEEQVKDGLVELQEPFEFVKDGQIVQRDLAAVLKANALKTAAQCEQAIARIDTVIEWEIAQHCSPGREMALTKAYLDWLNDGKPAGDDREREYRDMQKEVDRVKARHREARSRIRAVQARLKKRK